MTNKYVGPFFYIDGKLVSLKIDVSLGIKSGDFINHPTSHFEFFKKINADPYDDYGHYPRGRIIYNQRTNVFYIYVDKSLISNEKLINEIKKEYNLINGDVVLLRKDKHYTHDNL